MTPDLVPARLRHVRWIGGGSGAGKSTIARRLAADYGLHLYSCDPMQAEHTRRSNPANHPLLHDFLAMDMDERWVNRPPAVMAKTFHGFQGEGFDLILEDLLALPEAPPILAEGYKLLPQLVSPLLTGPNQAVWLVPTPQFRRAALEMRGSTWDIPRQTSNPERALSNLLARDELFSDEVIKQAAALQLRVIEVDGSLGVDEAMQRVAEGLALGSEIRPPASR
jgi:2-phosphoglycerate kinase